MSELRAVWAAIQDIQSVLEPLRKADTGGVAVSYTPTYEGGTTPGVTTYAANGQIGRYVRMGPLVFFYGRIQWTAATGTGQARISLPTTPVNTTNLFSSLSVDVNNVTFANSTPTGVLTPGVAYFFMRSPLTNAASTDVAIEAAGVVNFAGFFEVE